MLIENDYIEVMKLASEKSKSHYTFSVSSRDSRGSPDRSRKEIEANTLLMNKTIINGKSWK